MSSLMISKSTASSSSDDDSTLELRRGPWTVEEDRLLMHYVSCHGDGRWNSTAKCSGLRRTGKSCRLRWLNYLKPDVKRGNLTPQEQLLILELHSKWGNRWSKIAQHLPGRTDNEIKNYWRTRVQKQARHLKIDSNSSAFQEIIRCLWVPHLLQKIQGYSPPTTSATTKTNHQSDPNHVAQQQVVQALSQTGSLRHNPANSSSSEQFTESHNLSQSRHLPAQVARVSECSITSPFHHTNDNTMVNSETSDGNAEKFVNDPAILDDWYMLANTWVHDETEDSLWNMDDLWQL